MDKFHSVHIFNIVSKNTKDKVNPYEYSNSRFLDTVEEPEFLKKFQNKDKN